MGYTTEFEGAFKFSRPLSEQEQDWLVEFANTRHGGNTQPHPNMPGFYCQWVPDASGESLVWDGGEKFYCYVEWLDYLTVNFFRPWGVELSGEVDFRGESFHDVGTIVAKGYTFEVRTSKKNDRFNSYT